MNYSRYSGTKRDIASHLGVPENALEERLAKNNDKQSCIPGEYWSGLKNANGMILTPVREYFLGNECVYAEFVDRNGLTCAYMKFIDKSGRNAPLTVGKQIFEDGFENITPLSTYDGETRKEIKFNIQLFADKENKEKKNMSNLTEFDLRSLEKFADDLESFKERVKQICTKMESGIVYCQTEMKDEQSKAIMSKARATIDAIMKCVDPSILTLEKVKQLIDDIKNADVSL